MNSLVRHDKCTPTAIKVAHTRAGHLLEIVALKDNLIFLLARVRTLGDNTITNGHLANKLLTQEIADLDNRTVHGHVDRKVSICETHLVAESLISNGKVRLIRSKTIGTDTNLLTTSADDVFGQLRKAQPRRHWSHNSACITVQPL